MKREFPYNETFAGDGTRLYEKLERVVGHTNVVSLYICLVFIR